MADNVLLDEVGRLNRRKFELQEKNSRAEKLLQSIENHIEDLGYEKEKLDKSIQPLRDDEKSLKQSLSDLKRKVIEEQEALDKKFYDLKKERESLDLEKEQAKKEYQSFYKKVENDTLDFQKEQKKIAEQRKALTLDTKTNKESLDLLHSEIEKAKGEKEITDRDREEFDSKKKEIILLKDDLTNKKEELLRSLNVAKASQADIDLKTEALNQAEEAHKKEIELHTQRVASIESRESKVSADAETNLVNKTANETARKELERDQLRFSKLVREKELDRELEELKKEKV